MGKLRFLLLSLVITHAASAGAVQSIFWLASQYDWNQNQGFYLSLENSSPDHAPCRIETLRLILGVGDGEEWRFLSSAPPFEFDREYRVEAVIRPGLAELWLDGARSATGEAFLNPMAKPLWTNRIPAWANPPTDYLIVQTRLQITPRSGRPFRIRFPDVAPLSFPLFLFEPQNPRKIDWVPDPGEMAKIEAQFRIIRYPDLAGLSPFIDRYGQCTYADWPGKVRDDEELRKDIEREDAVLVRTGLPRDFDEYGGYTKSGWHEEGTGFFRVIRRGDYWWLISPEGNPCFYTGVNTLPGSRWPTTPVNDREFLFEWLPSEEEPWSSAWLRNLHGSTDDIVYVCFHTANLIRKYGAQVWAASAEERCLHRLKAWGFSGGGKWGASPSIVSCPVLSHGSTPKLGRHPDVFDATVREVFRRELEKQIIPRKDDPKVLGWSLGNEYHEIITRAEIAEILKKPSHTPAKRALLDHALNAIYSGSVERLSAAWRIDVEDRDSLYNVETGPPAEVLERLRCFYADRYYEFIYRTVKSIDPNHLYFGFWITPWWWESEEDWYLIARHCDVIGYDRYSVEFADDGFDRLLEATGKPVLCGEFSYPSSYQGRRGFGRYLIEIESDAAAGQLYERWVMAAARNPYCVGGLWFQYRNQPVTGRGPGIGPRLVHDEHYAFGLIDVTDRPKWELVKRMRKANQRAASWRLEAMGR